MTPGARYGAVAQVLDEIFATTADTSQILKRWGRANRFAGSKDRRAISDITYDILRHWPQWGGRGLTGRELALLHMKTTGQDVAALCGQPHGLGDLNTDEQAVLSGALPPRTPDGQAVYEDLKATFGPDLIRALAGLFERAPVDIRVHPGRIAREDLQNQLAEQGMALSPTPWSPWGLRGKSGLDLSQTEAFQSGDFEIQDEASQLAVALTAVQPGQTVVDLCAGGGGKTLALASILASLMQTGDSDGGRLLACDIDPKRLAAITPRLERAGLSAEMRELTPGAPELADLHGQVDVVVVDAPCSGSGVWRRHPEDAWRLTAAILCERHAAQAEVLRTAAQLLRPGGRMYYFTCSVLSSENKQKIGNLLAEISGLRPLDLAQQMEQQLGPEATKDLASRGVNGHTLQLSPHTSQTDGFFIAGLTRIS